MPAVAVIVPVHNYGRFLGEALDSVLAQTLADWECVIVDDGSTDDTAAVARRYVERDARFRYVHQSQRGLAGARNRGIDESSARYVQFLDADDRLAPGKLRRHVNWLDEHAETDVVYGEVTFFRSEEPDRVLFSLHGHLSRSTMARVHGNGEALRKLEHYNILPVLAALVRRDVFARAGRFDELARAYEDWGFWLRCAVSGCRFDFDGEDDPVGAVRTHAGSMSRDPRVMLRGLVQIATAYTHDERFAGKPLPLIYEVALGIDDVEQGHRREGARRIRGAASRANEALTAMRWRVYAIAALLLPRGWFVRLAAQPMPERPFEWYRRLRALFSR
jgi:glycosyltransferase involved in cell wall biosynthesis